MRNLPKNYVDIAAAVVAVFVLGVGAFLLINHFVLTESKPVATKYQAIKPCDLFTIDEAKAIDSTAALAEHSEPKANNDLSIATCSYGIPGATEADTKIASLTIRSALSDMGIKNNEAGFKQNKTDEMQPVEGYGDAAYYDASQGQLNIRDGKSWMIVTNGKTDPSTDTLDDAKLVADKVFN